MKKNVKTKSSGLAEKDASAPAEPARSTSALKTAFPVVGIGASAGGLEAVTQLLNHLPPRTGMGFVLVQHLNPTHESALATILARSTTMAALAS